MTPENGNAVSSSTTQPQPQSISERRSFIPLKVKLWFFLSVATSVFSIFLPVLYNLIVGVKINFITASRLADLLLVVLAISASVTNAIVDTDAGDYKNKSGGKFNHGILPCLTVVASILLYALFYERTEEVALLSEFYVGIAIALLINLVIGVKVVWQSGKSEERAKSASNLSEKDGEQHG